MNTFLLLIYKDKCTESSEHISHTHILEKSVMHQVKIFPYYIYKDKCTESIEHISQLIYNDKGIASSEHISQLIYKHKVMSQVNTFP